MTQLFEWTPPPWMPAQAWQAFVAMRLAKGKRNPWSELARDRAVKDLDAMRQRGIDIAEVLLICAEFGWVGVQWGENELAKRTSSMAQSRRGGGQPMSRQAQALAKMEGMKR